MTAFGKLIRTTAFRLTLAYLFLFALFAASLLGYFAWNTRRLITEQITTTVNAEFGEISDIFARRGLRGLVFTIENRALRPGANLYLVTTPAGQAVAGNVGSLAPGVMATTGWSETAYRRLDDQDTTDQRALVRVTELSNGFRLLEYLMKHAGQVVTRTMLLENVWDYHFDPQTNVIDVHISRLRSKIDKGFERPLLHTIRGAGYMIRDGIR